MIYFINIIIGLLFICVDLLGYNSNLLKYLVSFNSLAYLIIKKANIYVILAMAFAFIADYFLLFSDLYILGIILFILVQITYMHLLNYHNFLPLCLLIFIFIDPLITLALIYLCFSLLNLYHSYPISKSFFTSILLLLLCDITIGLVFLEIVDPSCFIFIWIFYLPSQLFFIFSFL